MAETIEQNLPANIAIIGTGEFARTMASRLLEVGLTPIIGSRFPSKRSNMSSKDILGKVKVVSIQECVLSSNVIILAIHPEHHASLKPLNHILAGKILVDVSNSQNAGQQSNAETLASFFPKSDVVKAFNTVSAYVMEAMFANRPVYVCGDNLHARDIVMQLASRLGFSSIDSGNLYASAKMEEANRKLLPGWGWPTFVMGFVSVIWIVYTICRYYVMRETPYTWERIPTNVLNKISGVISITLLALVYIPGAIAAFKQLANGTKHKRFHKSLDRWLKMRKHLGLYALFFGTLHTMLSLSLLSPAYFSSWYHKSSEVIPVVTPGTEIEIDIDSRMSLLGELCVMLGFLGIFFMVIQGITTIPSIANSLNWCEWQCLQSYMGFVCLLFCSAHVTVKGSFSWVEETWKDILPSMAFTSSVLPWFAIALRLFLLLPCVFIRVKQIRRGWERGNSHTVGVMTESGMNGNTHRTMIESGSDNKGYTDTNF